MLPVIFTILMIVVFGKLLWTAIKMAWSITKIVLRIVFLPLTLIFMFLSGLVKLSLIILVVIGVLSLFGSGRR